MPCFHSEDGTLHICRPSGETRPVEGKRRKRWWCFKCRKHLMHTRMMFDPGPESYYEPHFWWECPQCHEEHVLFPGWVWERYDGAYGY